MLGLYVSWVRWQRSGASRRCDTCRDLDEGQNPTTTAWNARTKVLTKIF